MKTRYPRHLWTVEWAANGMGYQVVVLHPLGNVIDECSAGNNPQDSIQCLPPSDPLCLPVDTLRTMAKCTAADLAEEHHIPETNIRENVELLTAYD